MLGQADVWVVTIAIVAGGLLLLFEIVPRIIQWIWEIDNDSE